jgi:hypothetical protein
VVRDVTGGYPAALGVCATLQASATIMILLGPGAPRPAHTPRESPR